VLLVGFLETNLTNQEQSGEYLHDS
jgi:hypothetical protein